MGPIPRGGYELTGPENVEKAGPHGPFVIRLVPHLTNEMCGRAGFLIHGDNKDGTASNGCIIPEGGRPTREKIWAQECKTLTVV